jgi:LysR family hydrogen peroxide-inducible transcriptional activator
MDTQRLRYFLEVVRQRNFSRAAIICNVSQPSLSQQVKKLEEEVGGMLLLRSHGNLQLTPLGEAFLKHAQAIISQVNAAEEFVSNHMEQRERTIRIGAVPTIAPYFVPGILKGVQTKLPQTRFELFEALTEQVVEALRTGRVDYALLSPPTALDDETDHLVLAKDNFVLTVPQEHRLGKSSQIDINELKGERVVLLEDSHCLSKQTAAYCQNIGLEADVTLASAQIETLLSIVEAGFGLTFIPESTARAHSHRKVSFIPLKKARCFREIRLLWWSGPFVSRSQKAFLDAVQAAFPFADQSSDA